MKTAFVFTGCGALGAYQAGVAKALAEKGIVPDSVYGVSSGAVNAIAYAYLGAGGNADFWCQMTKFSDAFELNLWNLFFRSGDGVFQHGKKMREWMRSALEGKKATVDGLVYVIKSSDGSLLPCRINPGESEMNLGFLNTLFGLSPFDVGMAACAVPGMCTSWKGYVDAGTRILAPLEDAIKAKSERIYVISGRPVGAEAPRKSFWPHAAAAGYYAIDSALTEVLRRDLSVTQERLLEARLLRKRFDPDNLGKKTALALMMPDVDVRVIQPKATVGGPTDFERCRDFYAEGLVAGDLVVP